MSFSQSDLRLHLKWIGGKWVNICQKKQDTAAIKLTEGNSKPSNSISSSTCSTDKGAQVTPSTVVNNLLNSSVSSSRNMSGRMDYESTVNGADLPPVPVFGSREIVNGTDLPHVPIFGSQKRVEQSVHKDNEFLRPLKKAREEEAITSTSIKAYSSKGTSIGVPIDEGTLSVLSLPMPKDNRSKSKNRKSLKQFFSELRSSPSLLRVKNDNHEVLFVSEQHEKADLELNGVGRKLSLESGSGKTDNVVKRGKGQPEGSGQQHQRGDLKPRILGLSYLCKGLQHESTTSKTMNNVNIECTPALSDTVQDHEAPFMSPGKACTATMEQNGGIEQESSAAELTIAQVDYAQLLSSSIEEDQCSEKPYDAVNGIEDEVVDIVEKVCRELLGPSVEELQTPSLCLGNSNPPMTEVEDGNNNLGIVQIACTQSNLKEHQTLPLCCDKPNQQIVDENEDYQLMPNAASTHNPTMENPKHTPSAYAVENSLNLEARADEIFFQSYTDVPTSTCSSPSQPDEGLEKDCLPFVKVSGMWERIMTEEAFQLIPQYPHFLPLEEENVELREGKAMGHMFNFAHVMESIRKASLDDPRRMFENKLEALDELEVFGFTVQALRSRLEKMITIKDNFSQLHERSQKTKVEVTDERHNADMIQESLGQLKIELQALLMQKEISGHKIAELQNMENKIEGKIHGARLDFDAVVAASW